jgi:monoamine oxidase
MKTIVIGAGLSGLMVAVERQSVGDEVVVLEARDRVGGRLWTLHNHFEDGMFGELGAETMYSGHNTVIELAKSLGLEFVSCGYFDPTAPPMLFDGVLLTENQRREITGWLLNAYEEFPPAKAENLAAWTARLGAPKSVIDFLTSYTQYTPVASLRHCDAAEFALQLKKHDADSYRIVGGNDLLAKRLAEKVIVNLNEVVRSIDWSGNQVLIQSTSGTHLADRVVVTVPGPLVSQLGFWPALPQDKVAALAELSYGTAAKVIVQYEKRDEISKVVGDGCFTNAVPPWIVDQSIHQAGDYVLTSSLPGGDSEPAVVDDAFIAHWDETVSHLLGETIEHVKYASHSWTTDPFSQAIVRAPLGDQRERILPKIAAPLGNKVFFAGEHTDDREGPGGLEGAARSAVRVLKEIATY